MIIEVKEIVCEKSYDLAPMKIEFSCVRDGKRIVIEYGFKLQNLVYFCCAKSINFYWFLFDGSVEELSHSNGHGSSISSSSVYDVVDSDAILRLLTMSNKTLLEPS